MTDMFSEKKNDVNHMLEVTEEKVTELTELLYQLCEHTEKEYYLPSSVKEWWDKHKVKKKYSEVNERILTMIEEILKYGDDYGGEPYNETAKDILEEVSNDITNINEEIERELKERLDRI